MKEYEVTNPQEIDVIDFFKQSQKDLNTEHKLPMTASSGNEVDEPDVGNLMGHKIKPELAKWILEHLIGKLLKGMLFNKIIYHRITYDSKDPQGNECKLSGLIIYPKFSNKCKRVSLPILAYNHATQLLKHLAPSRFKKNKPLDFMEVLIGMFFASQNGYIVSMADYQGMGSDTEHIHPYVCGNALAQSVIDLLDCTRDLLVNPGFLHKKKYIWNEELYLIGYSEGGYVTMATTKMIQETREYSDIYKITASCPMAGPHSLLEAMRFVMLRREEFGDGYFLPMTLRGFNAVQGDSYDGIFTKEKSLNSDADCQKLWDMADGTHSPEEINGAMPDIPCDILSDELVKQLSIPTSEAYQALKKNDLTEWESAPSMPMHLYHANDDDRVPFENSVIIKAAFKELGKDVPLIPMFHIPFGKSIHLEAALPAFFEGYHWINSIRNAPKNELNAGEYLKMGCCLESSNKLYRLRFQLDGNLALYKMDTDQLIWDVNSEIVKKEDKGKGKYVMLLVDGNFVVYDEEYKIIWQTKTKGDKCKLTVNVKEKNNFILEIKNAEPPWHRP